MASGGGHLEKTENRRLTNGKTAHLLLAEGECYTTFSTNVVMLKSESMDTYFRLLAVLNSRVIWGWLKHHAKRRGVDLEINGNVLNRIPVPADIAKDTADNK